MCARQYRKLSNTATDILHSLRIHALSRLSVCIDVWLLVVYAPQMTGLEVIQPLLSKGGGRQRMDDWTKCGALYRARQAHGSSSTFLEGALRDKNLDAAITRASCNIYLSKLGEQQAHQRRWSIAWDPGTYSGHQYNIGLAYSPDSGKAMTLPVKVT